MHLSFIYSSDDGVGCTCFNVLNAEPAGHLVAVVYLARIWHKANERVGERGGRLEDNYTIFSIVSSETTSYGLLFWLLDSPLDHGISLTPTSQPLSSSRVKRCFNFAEFTHVYVFGGISLRKKPVCSDSSRILLVIGLFRVVGGIRFPRTKTKQHTGAMFLAPKASLLALCSLQKVSSTYFRNFGTVALATARVGSSSSSLFLSMLHFLAYGLSFHLHPFAALLLRFWPALSFPFWSPSRFFLPPSCSQRQ